MLARTPGTTHKKAAEPKTIITIFSPWLSGPSLWISSSII
jgi:hypothetical protein